MEKNFVVAEEIAQRCSKSPDFFTILYIYMIDSKKPVQFKVNFMSISKV